MDKKQEIQKGQRAKALYEEFLKPYFDDMDRQLFEAFKQAQNDELAEIRRQSRTLDSMKAHLEKFIETGKLAQLQEE